MAGTKSSVIGIDRLTMGAKSRVHSGGDAPMISPREHQEAYQRALAWVGEQVTAAEGQDLTLNYLGGWDTYTPDPKTLERAWRVLYGIPDAMTDLLTSPHEQWAQVVLRWLRHHHERGPRGV